MTASAFAPKVRPPRLPLHVRRRAVMGFRFRKSIRLAPGLRLNLSKGGLSATLGRPGASINVGRRGVQGTAGLPGTGLSYQTRLDRGRSGRGVGLGAVVVLLLILSVWLLG